MSGERNGNGKYLGWKWLAGILLLVVGSLLVSHETGQNAAIEKKADKETVQAQYEAIIRQLNRIENQVGRP